MCALRCRCQGTKLRNGTVLRGFLPRAVIADGFADMAMEMNDPSIAHFTGVQELNQVQKKLNTDPDSLLCAALVCIRVKLGVKAVWVNPESPEGETAADNGYEWRAKIVVSQVRRRGRSG